MAVQAQTSDVETLRAEELAAIEHELEAVGSATAEPAR
jgi:hypothetical protein